MRFGVQDLVFKVQIDVQLRYDGRTTYSWVRSNCRVGRRH